MLPTRIRVQPVAHGGIEAKIGAKKMLQALRFSFLAHLGINANTHLTKKHKPVTIAVSPVFPPSEMPAPDSM